MGPYRLKSISQATGVSTRCFRDIRRGGTNETLKGIERATPAIEASHAEQRDGEQQLLNGRAECDRPEVRELARRLRADSANLG